MERCHYYTLLASRKIIWFAHKPSGKRGFYDSKLKILRGFPCNFRLDAMVLIRTFQLHGVSLFFKKIHTFLLL